MQWLAEAPSNIALIKYMGKKDGFHNIAMNPSLSYTLPHLLSNVELESITGKTDFWEPLDIPGRTTTFHLSDASQQRFLRHLKHIKDHLEYPGAFIVRSSNNFPQGSGLASSASSFAALTRCAVRAICELQGKPLLTTLEQAALSRSGSGSSCRSFFSPWVLWDKENVSNIELPYTNLIHQAVIISHEEKKISSSEAHRRVLTSSLYPSRTERALHHLTMLLTALRTQNWKSAYLITWKEFQDMHQLFTTCENPFSYITEESECLLKLLQQHWQTEGDGPLVTMDAGPNIHLLYRADQSDLAQTFKQRYLVGNYDVL